MSRERRFLAAARLLVEAGNGCLASPFAGEAVRLAANVPDLVQVEYPPRSVAERRWHIPAPQGAVAGDRV